MRYTVKKCPHCNYTYSTSTNNTPNSILGSPIRTCSKCKQTFVDHAYRELALTGIKPSELQLISIASVCFTVLFCLIGVLAVVLGSLLVGCVLWVGCILYWMYRLSTHTKRVAHLKKELHNSEKRLSNTLYAQILSKAGYDIPIRYLQLDYHPDEDTETESNLEKRLKHATTLSTDADLATVTQYFFNEDDGSLLRVQKSGDVSVLKKDAESWEKLKRDHPIAKQIKDGVGEYCLKEISEKEMNKILRKWNNS